MAINFSGISNSVRASGVLIEQQAIRNGVGNLILPQKLVLFGQYNTGKSPTANVAQLILSADDAAARYGTGSMLHLQAIKAFAVGGVFDVYAVPLADGAGAQATGSIVVSGPATGSGVIALFIAGQRLEIAVASGASAATIASAIQAKIAASVNLPVTATVSTATVTITARHKGLYGNDISIKQDLDSTDAPLEPAGVSLAITAMSGGTVNPDPTTALANLGATFYTMIAFPYTDSTSLTALDAAWVTRIGPTIKKPFVAFIGDVTVKATYQSAVAARNSPAETYINVEASPSMPCEIGAAAAANAAWSASANPARPWKNLVLKGIRGGILASLTYNEHDTLQASGGGTTDVISGAVVVHDLVTTYKTATSGASDDSFRYPETIANLQAKIYSLDQLFMSALYDRGVVIDDTSPTDVDFAIRPKGVKADIIKLVDQLWIAQAWSKNRADIVASIRAEINAGNAGRIDVQFQDCLALGGRIIAVKFTWTY